MHLIFQAQVPNFDNFNLFFSWIDKEKPLKMQKAGFSLNQYNLLEDIYDFVDNIQAEHSDRATVIDIGESYEGRPLKVIKISTNENNPVIFIEANIHAREWISRFFCDHISEIILCILFYL